MHRNIPNHDLIIECDQQNPDDDGRKADVGDIAHEGYQVLDKNNPVNDLDRRGLATPVSPHPRRRPRNFY
jgi:hypothetical protein